MDVDVDVVVVMIMMMMNAELSCLYYEMNSRRGVCYGQSLLLRRSEL